MTSTVDLDRLLLPDEHGWGPGFAGRAYSAAELDVIAENVNGTVQPGYGQRLSASTPGYQPGAVGGERARVPAGFDAGLHPNRAAAATGSVDPDVATEVAGAQQIDAGVQDWAQARGWVLDQHGRPLHPRHEQLLGDDRIGLPTGLGYGWWMGETVVADAVVTAVSGRVLVVPRTTDAGRIPSLPGGYAIPADEQRTVAQWRAGDRVVTHDGIAAAAARRVAAESGLVLPRWSTPRLVRGIRPVSSPHTMHAWTMTITVHVHLGDDLPALDTATGAEWVDVDELHDRVLPMMWPDHQAAAEAALD